MKKLIIAVLIAIVIPMSASAITPGDGGTITCTTSNYEKKTCNREEDQLKRIYQLEVLVNQLIEEKQGNITSTGQSCSELENRVSALESGFNSLLENVVGFMQTVISILTNR